MILKASGKPLWRPDAGGSPPAVPAPACLRRASARGRIAAESGAQDASGAQPFNGANVYREKLGDGHASTLRGLPEFERTLIAERTGEGRELARREGRRLGRPPKLTAHQKALIEGWRDRVKVGGGARIAVWAASDEVA